MEHNSTNAEKHNLRSLRKLYPQIPSKDIIVPYLHHRLTKLYNIQHGGANNFVTKLDDIVVDIHCAIIWIDQKLGQLRYLNNRYDCFERLGVMDHPFKLYEKGDTLMKLVVMGKSYFLGKPKALVYASLLQSRR